MDYTFEQYRLKEANAARIMNMLQGEFPSVYTIGVITWANPVDHENAPHELNHKANNELQEHFRDMRVNFVKLKEKYTSKSENYYLVMNISRSALCNLGFDGKQGWVIYGRKIDNDTLHEFDFSEAFLSKFDSDNYLGMVFQSVLLKPYNQYDKVVSQRNVLISKTNHEDHYAEIKGKQFMIPFLDDDIAKENHIDFIKTHIRKIGRLDLKAMGMEDMTHNDIKNEIETMNLHQLSNSRMKDIYDKLYKTIFRSTRSRYVLDYSNAYTDEHGRIRGAEEVRGEQIQEVLDYDDRIELERLQKKLALGSGGLSAMGTIIKIDNIYKKYRT